MKTIGIITLYGLSNYGNRLQNYAVQKILTDMGFSAKTYDTEVYYRYFSKKTRIKKWINELTHYHFSSSLNAWATKNRNMLFQDFTKKYLPTERVEVKDIQSLGSKADYFVIGSDQVWNPTFYVNNKKQNEIYILSFTQPEQRVCFSPSFGLSTLPEEWEEWFRNGLKSFPSLNVREQAGADIIKKLTGIDAQVTIDPTLMVNSEDWHKIAKKPYGVDTKHPYLLTYFLGDRTAEVDNDINQIINEKKMNVYHLLDKRQPFIYESGPREFLYLFSKAEIVLTDSFHGCVFSFLFNRPFVVYNRVESGMCQMTSRIESFVQMFGLQRKDRNRNERINWFECNYTLGKVTLYKERSKMKTYLERAFQL